MELFAWTSSEKTNGVRTNLIYANKSMLQSFRLVNLNPDKFHIWSETDEMFCYRITSCVIGYPKMMKKKSYWTKSLKPIIYAKYCILVNSTTQKLVERSC